MNTLLIAAVLMGEAYDPFAAREAITPTVIAYLPLSAEQPDIEEAKAAKLIDAVKPKPAGKPDRKVAGGEPLTFKPKPQAKPVQQPKPAAAPRPTWAPGTRFLWLADGQYHDTPQPGLNYPSVGVWATQQVAQAPQPKAIGHWVKRCYGTYCRMEWVPG